MISPNTLLYHCFNKLKSVWLVHIPGGNMATRGLVESSLILDKFYKFYKIVLVPHAPDPSRLKVECEQGITGNQMKLQLWNGLLRFCGSGEREREKPDIRQEDTLDLRRLLMIFVTKNYPWSLPPEDKYSSARALNLLDCQVCQPPVPSTMTSSLSVHLPVGNLGCAASIIWYGKKCCSEHRGTNILPNQCFHILLVSTQ